MGKSVFISHSSKDKAVAFELCERLEKVGVSCWIAPRDVKPGGLYGTEIIAGIKQCSVFLLVLTSDANQSDAVTHEVERAFSYQKTIIPLRIREVMPGKKIEFFVSAAQWVDAFQSPISDRVDYIASVVRYAETGEPPKAPPPERISFGAKLERHLETVFRHKLLTAMVAFALLLTTSVVSLGIQSSGMSQIGVLADSIDHNLQNVKKETSDDPRKELANQGILWDRGALHSAIVNGDVKVVQLFLDGGMKLSYLNVDVALGRNNQTMLNLLLQRVAEVDKELDQMPSYRNDCRSFAYAIYGLENKGINPSPAAAPLINSLCEKREVIQYINEQVETYRIHAGMVKSWAAVRLFLYGS